MTVCHVRTLRPSCKSTFSLLSVMPLRDHDVHVWLKVPTQKMCHSVPYNLHTIVEHGQQSQRPVTVQQAQGLSQEYQKHPQHKHKPKQEKEKEMNTNNEKKEREGKETGNGKDNEKQKKKQKKKQHGEGRSGTGEKGERVRRRRGGRAEGKGATGDFKTPGNYSGVEPSTRRSMERCISSRATGTLAGQDTGGIKTDQVSGRAGPALVTLDGPHLVSKLLGEPGRLPSGHEGNELFRNGIE